MEIVEEVGEENAFIFGMSCRGSYRTMRTRAAMIRLQLFNTDQDIRHVLMQLINGEYSPNDPERFRELYNALLIDEWIQPSGSIFHPEGFPFLCRGTEACRSCIPR